MEYCVSHRAKVQFVLSMKPIYLYVCPFFPSAESWRGGFFLDAVEALVRDGRYEVKVLVGQPGADYVVNGIKVARFSPVKIGCSDCFHVFTDFVKIWQFARKLKTLGVDIKDVAVCHVHLLEKYAIYGEWLKKKNPNSFVMVHHHLTGAYPLCTGWQAKIPYYRELEFIMLRRAYESVDSHVFCSNATMSAYGKYYTDGVIGPCHNIRDTLCHPWRFRDMKCPLPHVEYNGVNHRVFNDDRDGQQRDVFVVGCVANFLPTKSQITLLEAYAKVQKSMPRSKIIFVGSGVSLGSCRLFVKEMQIESRVEFKVEMPHDEMPWFYRSLDLYVLPSYSEAFNCSLIEAWACGVPCITTDAISFKEVLPKSEWDKWLFPPRDADSLANRLLWAYKTRPRKQLLSKDLDIDSIARGFLDWVESQRQI